MTKRHMTWCKHNPPIASLFFRLLHCFYFFKYKYSYFSFLSISSLLRQQISEMKNEEEKMRMRHLSVTDSTFQPNV